ASLVLLSPQTEKHSLEFSEEKHIGATILSDPGNETAARYGLRFQLPDDLKKIYLQFGIDLPKYNEEASWTLALPARLIIDQEGIVRYAQINVDYTQRPEPEDTLAALRAL
ncbi:MAG: redoxin domain-containing protein, partial [Desulfobacterales bacterium]